MKIVALKWNLAVVDMEVVQDLWIREVIDAEHVILDSQLGIVLSLKMRTVL